MKTAYILSYGVAVLAATASAGGLLIDGLYRDSDFYKTAWLGNDIITLAVAVPMLIAATYHTNRRSQRAQLVWVGSLAFMIYNFAFYLFGAAFNKFFLLYAALFAATFYSLVLGFSGLNIKEISKKFHEKTPVRPIAVYLILISVPLAVIEGGQCVGFIFTDNLPQIPSLILALDLAVIVPNSALAAILLWQRKPWGFVLGAVMLVKGLTYGLVLMSGTSLIAVRGLGPWDPLMPFYTFVALGGLTSLIVLLKNMNRI